MLISFQNNNDIGFAGRWLSIRIEITESGIRLVLRSKNDPTIHAADK